MNNLVRKIIVTVLILSAASIGPAFCDCSIEGAVCGDQPTWDPCCNPDKSHCELENPNDPEGERYGICTGTDADNLDE